MKESQRCSEEATDEGNDSNSDCDQDSDASFMNDTDEEIDTAEIEEDCIEYMKGSTAAAVDQMRTAKTQCWIETHERMKWRLAMRIAALPAERWSRTAAEWNPDFSTKNTKPTEPWEDQEKRWEDEINEFLRTERIEEETNNDERNHDESIKTEKDQKSWKNGKQFCADDSV